MKNNFKFEHSLLCQCVCITIINRFFLRFIVYFILFLLIYDKNFSKIYINLYKLGHVRYRNVYKKLIFSYKYLYI